MDRARAALEESVDTFTELGGRFYAAQGLAEMGRSAIALGNDTEAERVWRESLRIATDIHGIPVALEPRRLSARRIGSATDQAAG